STPIAHRHLPSFPTRRSSDLIAPAVAIPFNAPPTPKPPPTTLPLLAFLSARYSSLALCSLTISSYFSVTVSNARELSKNSRHFRSEEHTSELQSRFDLVCRLL